MIQRPGRPSRRSTATRLDAIWSGELVLLTTREARRRAGRFNFTWFIPQIVRYRGLIGEVLLITFVAQPARPGRAAPFQNVIDKVLAHNALSTLNVLAIGFVAVSRGRRCSAGSAPALCRNQPEDRRRTGRAPIPPPARASARLF